MLGFVGVEEYKTLKVYAVFVIGKAQKDDKSAAKIHVLHSFI